MQDNTEAIKRSQLRSFGLIVATGFSIIGVFPVLIHGTDFRSWSLVIAGLLAFLALVVPRILTGLYRLWMVLGGILGWVNTRIILAIGFYGLFMPVGLVMRALGKDPMRRNFEVHAKTYRIKRARRHGSHMRKQF
jgi:hypothetical protein